MQVLLDLTGSCSECGGVAGIVSIQRNAQTGKHCYFEYCDVCFASDNHPDKLRVSACRLGVDGEILFIPDDTQCVNCDSYLIAPDARISKEWEIALRGDNTQ